MHKVPSVSVVEENYNVLRPEAKEVVPTEHIPVAPQESGISELTM